MHPIVQPGTATAIPVPPPGGLSPVCDWLPRSSLSDFPGHPAALFFVSGCNFACGFCHNARRLAQRRDGRSWGELDRVCRRFREGWLHHAVISGGEPTLHDDLPELITFLHRRGFRVKLDTNGSNPALLNAVLPRVDYVAMDIKCALHRYPEVVRFDDIDRIAESVGLIRKHARDYEFRTTVVDGLLRDEDFDAIVRLVRGARRYVLQPFLPRPDLPGEELRSLPRTPPGRLAALRDRMKGCADEVAVRGA
jgi:pyruvate formate lyase activating enzyme